MTVLPENRDSEIDGAHVESEFAAHCAVIAVFPKDVAYIGLHYQVLTGRREQYAIVTLVYYDPQFQFLEDRWYELFDAHLLNWRPRGPVIEESVREIFGGGKAAPVRWTDPLTAQAVISDSGVFPDLILNRFSFLPDIEKVKAKLRANADPLWKK